MPLTTRVIACLDVAAGRVVKGIQFTDLQDAGDPVELTKKYNDEGIDELVFLDVTAATEGRGPILDVIEKTAAEVFIPFTIGGGITKLEHVDQLLRAGADKVSVNTGALENPVLLRDIADRFGAQVTVLSVDTKRSLDTKSGFELTTHGGRKRTGIDLIDWVKQASEFGIGEILLNSMDFDGTKQGFDLEVIKLVRNETDAPVIASGGAGQALHFPAAVLAGADAVLAASIFHFGEVSVAEVKAELKQVTPIRT